MTTGKCRNLKMAGEQCSWTNDEDEPGLNLNDIARVRGPPPRLAAIYETEKIKIKAS